GLRSGDAGRPAAARLQRLHLHGCRHLPLLVGRDALRAHAGPPPPRRLVVADLELLRPDARRPRHGLAAEAVLRRSTARRPSSTEPRSAGPGRAKPAKRASARREPGEQRSRARLRRARATGSGGIGGPQRPKGARTARAPDTFAFPGRSQYSPLLETTHDARRPRAERGQAEEAASAAGAGSAPVPERLPP